MTISWPESVLSLRHYDAKTFSSDLVAGRHGRPGGVAAGHGVCHLVGDEPRKRPVLRVDLGTRVATKIDSGEARLRMVTASRGETRARSTLQSTKTYIIRNVDAKAKIMIIEHPIREGSQWIGVKPTETTTTAHRLGSK